MSILKSAALGAAILLGSAINQGAQAAMYQLVGVTFGDGGTATGGFDFDPVQKLFFNVSITTTTTINSEGFVFPGATYTEDDTPLFDTYNGEASNNANFLQLTIPCLQLPVISCSVSGNEFTTIFGDDGNFQLGREIQAGTVAPIPLPAPVLLFATGLAGVVGLSRARRRKRDLAQA